MSFRVLGQVTFFRGMIYDGRCRSLTGAWIETFRFAAFSANIVVAPLRGRGLKQEFVRKLRKTQEVAPLRGRGLKHPHLDTLASQIPSLPYGGVD